MAKKRPERGEYRGIFVALADDPDFQNLSMEAQWVFFALKLRLGRAGIDVFYPAALAEQFGKGSGKGSGNPSGNPYERVTEAIAELIAEGWVRNERNVYWIRNGLRHDPAEPLKVPNMRTSIEAHLKTLPKLAIVNEMARHYELTAPFPDLAPEGVPVRVDATLTARDTAPRKTEDGNGGTTNGAKAPTAAPPNEYASKEGSDPLAAARAEAAVLIREHLWRGPKPPPTAGSDWSMKRDLSIWKQLLKQFRPEEINGAITVCRVALAGEVDPTERPLTMAYFARDGTRDRMSRCVAMWRQLESKKLAKEKNPLVLIGETVEEVRRAATG